MTDKVNKLRSTLLVQCSLSCEKHRKTAWAEKAQLRTPPRLLRKYWMIPLVIVLSGIDLTLYS